MLEARNDRAEIFARLKAANTGRDKTPILVRLNRLSGPIKKAKPGWINLSKRRQPNMQQSMMWRVLLIFQL